MPNPPSLAPDASYGATGPQNPQNLPPVEIHMDVFLIPVASSSYELYYEAPDEPAGEAGGEAGEDTGVFARWRQRFNQMLREAEEQRHEPSGAAPEPPGLLQRAQRRTMRYIAARIAEQRLLWHLRRVDRATVHIPSDLTEAEALQHVRKQFKSDADRHLRWGVVNLLLLIASAPLALVPGPNVVAYLFTFNVVGHFLAMRGARRGLSGVTWTVAPSAPLAELRAALTQQEPQRYHSVHDVAKRLRLQHLTRFFDRMAVPTA